MNKKITSANVNDTADVDEPLVLNDSYYCYDRARGYTTLGRSLDDSDYKRGKGSDTEKNLHSS